MRGESDTIRNALKPETGNPEAWVADARTVWRDLIRLHLQNYRFPNNLFTFLAASKVPPFFNATLPN